MIRMTFQSKKNKILNVFPPNMLTHGVVDMSTRNVNMIKED